MCGARASLTSQLRPPLLPCLLPLARAAAKGDIPEAATRHLQQLLLEGVANGSVRGEPDVARLLCSTFAAFQQV